MNNTKLFFIKPGFIKSSMRIIHTKYYVNLYFFVIYNTHNINNMGCVLGAKVLTKLGIVK